MRSTRLFLEAQELAKKTTHLSPPKIILKTPTALMQQMGMEKGISTIMTPLMDFLGKTISPMNSIGQAFYHPVERGFEREMKKRLEYFEKIRKN